MGLADWFSDFCANIKVKNGDSISRRYKAITKSYDLGELAQKHRQAAADLWLVRERYLALITDLRVGKEALEKITWRRDELLEDLDGVYSGAPTYQAYKKAQDALQRYEEMTFSDDEIDALLPRELKRASMQPASGESK